MVSIHLSDIYNEKFSSHDLQGFARRYGRALRPQEPAIGFDGDHFHHGPICGQERHMDVIPLERILVVLNQRELSLFHWSVQEQLFKMNTEWRAEYMPTPKTLTYHDEQGFCRRYGRLLRSEEPTIAFDGGFFHHGRRCGRERHRDVLPLDEVLMVPFSPPPPLIATVSSKFEEHMADLCVRIAAQCCKQAEDRFFWYKLFCNSIV
ncbi:hypothetical protein QR680_014718 [Steinernema hermaphroditum]|uniref:Uncharacterized protein n=1 Tax=Steinernema hermaphroditum TaxID=289476 RepID=A0AA39IC43_9BILA|nr:hypothetical protein QR680_014718 [Steinernema hermaphroditum]